MKQNTKQINRQSLVLTPLLQNKIKLLSLSGYEIRLRLKQEIEDQCDKEEGDRDFSFFKDILKLESYSKNFSSGLNLQKEYLLTDTNDLRQNLLEQLYMLNLKDHELLIGEYLIDSIDSNGRLDQGIDFCDICKLVKDDLNKEIEKPDIKKVLTKIQNLDPVGCGYITITESLLIQTDHIDVTDEEKDHLKDLLKKIESNLIKMNKITGKYYHQGNAEGRYVGEFKDHKFHGQGTMIYADGTEKKGIWEVSLNDEFLIRSLTEKIEFSVQDKKRKGREETLSFLKGLERRQQTMVKVGDFILKKQQFSLVKGEDLLPLSIKDISASLDMSESSVSRIVQSKYLQLPNKIIPLSSLLQKKVNTDNKNQIEISPNKLIKII